MSGRPMQLNDTFCWHLEVAAPRDPTRSLQSEFHTTAQQHGYLDSEGIGNRFMNIICLAIDALHIGMMGCYGSDSVPTPAIDRLASESFVFDQYLLDSPHPARVYRSLWQGAHALSKTSSGASLAELFAAGDWQTTLVSDDSNLFENVPRAGFRKVKLLPAAADRSAASVSETGFAQFFEAAVDAIAEIEGPELLWLHSRGMTSPWDAPYSFRDELVEDEDEPPPPTMSTVPTIADSEALDPDELLGIRRAYGGQVKLFDECLAAFLDVFESSGLAENTLLVLLGVRGFSLGEHATIGHYGTRLHEELIHVPCLMHFPDALGADERSSEIIQPCDLGATLLDWGRHDGVPSHGQSLMPLLRGDRLTVRDRACTVAYDPLLQGGMPSELAIRTKYWHLRLDMRAPSTEEDSLAVQPSLYVKPDDRWEQNEISSRCADQVEALRTAIDDFETAVQSEHASVVAPLDDCLIEHAS